MRSEGHPRCDSCRILNANFGEYPLAELRLSDLLGSPLWSGTKDRYSPHIPAALFRGSSKAPGSRLSPNAHAHHVEVVIEGPNWSLQAVGHRGEQRIEQREILVPVWEDRNGGVPIVLHRGICEEGCARHLGEESVGLSVA